MSIKFHKAKRKTQLYLTTLLAIISFGISFLISFSGFFSLFEYKIYDLLSRYTAQKNTTEDILIIRVDQRSLDGLNKSNGISWPWPRQVYEPLLEILEEAEAVFIDVIFSEPSVYGMEDDDIFGDAVMKADNIFVAMPLTNDTSQINGGQLEFLEKISAPSNMPVNRFHKGFIAPINELRKTVRGAGNVTIAPDQDGIYRKMPLLFGLGEYKIPHLILSYFVDKKVIHATSRDIILKDNKIPLVDNKLLIKFDGRKRPFNDISFGDVFNAALDPDSQNPTQKLSKDYFRGKYVFIGYTAKGLYDLRPTPVSPSSPGVFVLATAFENLLHNNYLKIIDKENIWILMFLICFLTSFVVLASIRIIVNLTFFIVFLGIFWGTITLLFYNGIYIKPLGPFSALFLSYLFTLIYSYSSEGRERAFVRATFSQYMDKKIVDHILENPDLIAPGGSKIRGTVFFTDIAGFTTISEKISAEETATMLYHLLTVMSDLIIRNKGIIDKYIGDSIMAFWGAPAASDNDETNACKAALDCTHALKKVNKSFKKNIPEIGMRFGIHSGELIAGNLGSEQLFDYTVIGDTVNLASRLESVNKYFGTKIIISEATLEKADNIFLTRMLGDIAVKGKSEPIRIYELVGRKGKVKESIQEKTDLFELGIQLFYEQEFANASEIFYSILKKYEKDRPTELYLERCKAFIESPPRDDNWQIIIMKEK